MPVSVVDDGRAGQPVTNGGSRRSSIDKSRSRRTSLDERLRGPVPVPPQINGLVNGRGSVKNHGSSDFSSEASSRLSGSPKRESSGINVSDKAPTINMQSKGNTTAGDKLDHDRRHLFHGLFKSDDRDDGHFAEAPEYEKESSFLGFSSTRVTLNAGHGEVPPFPLPKTQQARDNVSQALHDSQSSTNMSPTTNDDRNQQPHRISSPPAFQDPSAANAAAISSTAPNPLTKRHTLEVPKPSSSRLSRELPRPSEDAYASGRYSPAPNTPTRRRNSISLVRRMTKPAHSDLHLEEPPQDEDADRWADMIKQRRASKRRKKEEEDEDRVVMGTKVDQNHVNYVTAYNMLTGIRFTVSRTNAKLDRELVEADFDAKHKFSFDITGNELTPSAKYDFKFKDYAPWVFRHLRQIFRIDPADYLVSLTSKYILSELGSPGKSGSFFYFSRDYKYIIKTIHHAEHKVLRRILREYYAHVRNDPNTLLSQFYGLHRVKVPYGRKIHFVVMNNLFPPHRDIHKTFDLKGSTTGRDFKEEDLESNPRATLKDLNWLRRNMHLELGPAKKQRFVEQMEKDVALLQKLKIMDYSLLVGIHDLSRGNEDKLRDKTLQVFQPGGEKGDEVMTNALMRTPSKLETQRKAKELRGTLRQERPVPMNQTMDKLPEEMADDEQSKDFYFYSDDRGFRATHEDNSPGEQTYYLGIIDCLTHYGLIKRLEHFWKGLNHTESQISAIPPERYGDRFVHFISGVTKSKELIEEEVEEKALKPLDRRSSSIRAATERQQEKPPAVSRTSSHTRTQQEKKSDEAVVDRNERAAERTIERNGGMSPEPLVPERNLATIRNSNDDPADPSSTYTLPVVEEAASESGSTNGKDTNNARDENAGADASANGAPTRQSTTSTSSTSKSKEPKAPGRPPPPTPPEEEAEEKKRLEYEKSLDHISRKVLHGAEHGIPTQ